jgi:uncharacterized membrane protein YeiH
VYIYTLDLIGVFAFAVFGSYKALEKGFNTYGVITCAALTALGGGTIRELILRHIPIYFTNHAYLYVTLAAAVLTIAVREHFLKVRHYVLIIDAIGLAAFAFIGARKADMAGLGLVGMVFFAILTAAGGGILTDIVAGDKPSPFSDELYVFPAAIGGSLYWLIDAHRAAVIATGIVLAVPFTIRTGWLAQRGEFEVLQRLASKFRGLDAHRASIAVPRPALRSSRPGRSAVPHAVPVTGQRPDRRVIDSRIVSHPVPPLARGRR